MTPLRVVENYAEGSITRLQSFDDFKGTQFLVVVCRAPRGEDSGALLDEWKTGEM